MTVPVAMIAAVARNGVIGAGNAIPWRLPTDFAHFKRTTMGKPLVMGRKTFESIGRPLPGRTTIVVTRQADWHADGVVVARTLDEAMGIAQDEAARAHVAEVIVAGGGEIYREAMPIADRLYITHVDLAPVGDATFPAVDPAHWHAAEEIAADKTSRDSADFRIIVYERNRPARR